MALSKMKTRWIEVMIIVMALGLLSLCFAAWDNTRPGSADPVTDWPDLIGANWDALEAELGINLNEAHPYYQSSSPTTKPDASTALDVDDNGRLWIDSDDNIVYILTDYSGITWTKINPVLANDTYFTSVDNAGTGTVDLIKANTSDVAVLPDGSEMASSGAPTADADIANKKYVDDQDTADHPAYTGGESHTDGSGLITKTGFDGDTSATPGAVSFGTSFPGGVVSLQITQKRTTSGGATSVKALSDSGFTAIFGSTTEGYYWTAIGY